MLENITRRAAAAAAAVTSTAVGLEIKKEKSDSLVFGSV